MGVFARLGHGHDPWQLVIALLVGEVGGLMEGSSPAGMGCSGVVLPWVASCGPLHMGRLHETHDPKGVRHFRNRGRATYKATRLADAREGHERR